MAQRHAHRVGDRGRRDPRGRGCCCVRPDARRDALIRGVEQRACPHVRPGGRIAAAGGKRAPAWMLPANLYLGYAMRRYTTTMDGFDRPWRILEALVPDLQVE